MRYVLFALCLLLVGCGARTETEGDSLREQVSESHTTTKEVTVHTPTANGGYIIEKTTTTDATAGERSKTASKESTHTAPDAATNALIAGGARLAGAVIGPAVSSATGGLLGGDNITEMLKLLIAGGVAAYGGAKASQAKQLREERDFHKGDADHAYKRLEERGAV